MVADPEIDFLLSPVNSDFATLARKVTEPKQRVLLSQSAASDSYYEGTKYAFSILTSSKQLFTSTLPSLRFLGVKSIAYISDSNPFANEACKSLEGIAKSVGIEFLGGTANPLAFGTS